MPLGIEQGAGVIALRFEDRRLYTGVPVSVLPIPRSTHLSELSSTDK